MYKKPENQVLKHLQQRIQSIKEESKQSEFTLDVAKEAINESFLAVINNIITQDQDINVNNQIDVRQEIQHYVQQQKKKKILKYLESHVNQDFYLRKKSVLPDISRSILVDKNFFADEEQFDIRGKHHSLSIDYSSNNLKQKLKKGKRWYDMVQLEKQQHNQRMQQLREQEDHKKLLDEQELFKKQQEDQIREIEHRRLKLEQKARERHQREIERKNKQNIDEERLKNVEYMHDKLEDKFNKEYVYKQKEEEIRFLEERKKFMSDQKMSIHELRDHEAKYFLKLNELNYEKEQRRRQEREKLFEKVPKEFSVSPPRTKFHTIIIEEELALKQARELQLKSIQEKIQKRVIYAKFIREEHHQQTPDTQSQEQDLTPTTVFTKSQRRNDHHHLKKNVENLRVSVNPMKIDYLTKMRLDRLNNEKESDGISITNSSLQDKSFIHLKKELSKLSEEKYFRFDNLTSQIKLLEEKALRKQKLNKVKNIDNITNNQEIDSILLQAIDTKLSILNKI
ncbi:UNKNOWN [Stylonychia lemnae]|uniref:Uncharacterized protein n=1 Tax=Stylonychia lemnae TaxID=5949 RepID=A0A078AH15_STYLE|nr:UNKNOWN [Stylonychia lemnae]|eukprot:CDW81121.1 UNKNOWN [Stylonychia lemnae]